MHGVHQIDQVPINQINVLSIEHSGIDVHTYEGFLSLTTVIAMVKFGLSR